MSKGKAAKQPRRANTRGYLMPIGGAEDKKDKKLVLQRFVALAGGPAANIVVLPTASGFAQEVGVIYDALLTHLGAKKPHVIHIKKRAQANDPDVIAPMQNASGIFMSGGDQVKLMSLIGGTALEAMLKARYEAGAVVAGTSAGASAISEHMIAFGRGGSAPSFRMVNLAAGLGLVKGVVIDQHFRERDRVGRLMTALTFNPALVGIGVDEDTAFIIGPDGQAEVIGSGSVTIVDGRGMDYTDVYYAKQHQPIAIFGMKVHILTAGCGYNLLTHSPRPHLLPAEESTVREAASDENT
jgi:cyanophycinase